MKVLSIIFIFVLSVTYLNAQIPRKISYQGVLTNSSGSPAQDGNYTLEFRLYDVSSGGSSLYSETHTSVSVQRGSFKAVLGSVTPLTLPFDLPYYLEMTVTAGPEIVSPVAFDRSPFSSVPYSLRADTAQYVKNVKLSFPYLDTNVVSNDIMLALGNKGTGFGAFFVNNNTSNPSPALIGKTTGTGVAVIGNHDGSSGNAGQFEIVNPSNSSSALYAHTPGSGSGVEGMSDAGGAGVKGTSYDGFGVAGYSTSGTGVYGSNDNSNTIGHAGYFNGKTRVTQDMLVDRYLGVGTSTPGTRLDILGGQYDLSSTEGDLRIGDGTYRLKFGIATGGGGAGDARIRAQGGLNRLSLGVNTNDVLTLYNTNVGVGVTNPSTSLHLY